MEKTLKNVLALGATAVTDITAFIVVWEKVCRILDPFGTLWWLNQRVAEVDFTNPESPKMAQPKKPLKE